MTQQFKNNMIKNLGANSFCITQKSFMTGRETDDRPCQITTFQTLVKRKVGSNNKKIGAKRDSVGPQ